MMIAGNPFPSKRSIDDVTSSTRSHNGTSTDAEEYCATLTGTVYLLDDIETGNDQQEAAPTPRQPPRARLARPIAVTRRIRPGGAVQSGRSGKRRFGLDAVG